MEFVDFSQTPPKKIVVHNILGVSRQVASNQGTYTLSHIFEEWIDNAEIETPTPAFEFEGESYWKPEQIAEWQSLYDQEIEREEDRKAKALVTETVSKLSIVEQLLSDAQAVLNRNVGCYNHNRGNSMQDGRRRVLLLEGKIEFVKTLLGDAVIPKEQQQKLNELVRGAKEHVNMQ